jgi:hypothetical protein
LGTGSVELLFDTKGRRGSPELLFNARLETLRTELLFDMSAGTGSTKLLFNTSMATGSLELLFDTGTQRLINEASAPEGDPGHSLGDLLQLVLEVDELIAPQSNC